MQKNLCLLSVFFGIIALFSFNNLPDGNIYSVPKEFLPTFQHYQINPKVASHLQIGDKGTLLHIPKNAFVDAQGNIVDVPISLQFKAYNHAADIAFSAIPMRYQGDNFNSSGMFEIQGKVEGVPIQIAPNKQLTIDYHLAKKNPNTDFYRLNEQSQTWELISYIKEMTAPKLRQKIAQNNIDHQDNPINNRNKTAGRNAVNLNNNKGFVIEEEKAQQNSELVDGQDASHTYPDLIRGLNVGSFGVYNCDQIYAVPNRVKLIANYQDSKGNKLSDLHVLSLIDLDYNAAFSFSPEQFTCNAKGNNVLLLFSQSGELYLLDKGEFAKMNIKKDGHYTFTVKNVSDFIRNTEELANYLGIITS